jgi:hypothetical protein
MQELILQDRAGHSTCRISTHDVMQQQFLQGSTYRITDQCGIWDGSVHARSAALHDAECASALAGQHLQDQLM